MNTFDLCGYVRIKWLALLALVAHDRWRLKQG